MRYSPEIDAYKHMVQRCYNQNNKTYRYYGGRGIRVCKRWLGENGMDCFLADMGIKPSSEYSLDRKDVNGNYSPENCRWADSHTQGMNRRMQVNNKTSYRGVHWHTKRARYVAALTAYKRHYYLGCFETPEEAAIAYDCGTIQINGSDAPTNIIMKVRA